MFTVTEIMSPPERSLVGVVYDNSSEARTVGIDRRTWKLSIEQKARLLVASVRIASVVLDSKGIL